MSAIMEKKAREIFRDALMLHYIDDICAAGEEVESWLKTHGGWFPDQQQDYGYGSQMPEADGPDVMSKEPNKAANEAKGVMSLLAEFLGDGIAEHMGRSDLKASAQKWLDDLAGQAAPSETPKRDRSRSPRRCVIPDLTIAVLKETIRLQEATNEALRGYIKEKNSELIKNAYRISYLETTVKAKDEMLAMKDDLHNKVMAGMENLFKKP